MCPQDGREERSKRLSGIVGLPEPQPLPGALWSVLPAPGLPRPSCKVAIGEIARLVSTNQGPKAFQKVCGLWIRPLVLTGKNALFAAHDEGGPHIRTEHRQRYSETKKLALLAEVDRGGSTVGEVEPEHLRFGTGHGGPIRLGARAPGCGEGIL